MKLHAWTIKTNGKWSASRSAKFGLWNGYVLYTSLWFCQTKCSVYLPVFLIASISVCWPTCTEKVAPCVTCVGQCIMVTTFYILGNLLSESMLFSKRLGWENTQRGLYVSRYSACERWQLMWMGWSTLAEVGQDVDPRGRCGCGLMQYCCDLQKGKSNTTPSRPVNLCRCNC